MAYTHAVVCAFGGDPRHLCGELVDTSGWNPKNVRSLVTLGNLGPVPAGNASVAVCRCGKVWLNGISIRHDCSVKWQGTLSDLLSWTPATKSEIKQ